MTNQTNHTNPNLNGFAISQEMYAWLLVNLPPRRTILEFGSGNGTIELTKYWKVISVEDKLEWMGVAPESTYIHAPLKDYGDYEWFDIDILKKEIPKKYDCILIDAPTGKGRMGIIDFMHLLPKWDVPILVDDTHREEEKRLATKLGGILGRGVYDYSGFEKNFSVIE